eukprot:g2389.t1
MKIVTPPIKRASIKLGETLGGSGRETHLLVTNLFGTNVDVKEDRREAQYPCNIRKDFNSFEVDLSSLCRTLEAIRRSFEVGNVNANSSKFKQLFRIEANKLVEKCHCEGLKGSELRLLREACVLQREKEEALASLRHKMQLKLQDDLDNARKAFLSEKRSALYTVREQARKVNDEKRLQLFQELKEEYEKEVDEASTFHSKQFSKEVDEAELKERSRLSEILEKCDKEFQEEVENKLKIEKEQIFSYFETLEKNEIETMQEKMKETLDSEIKQFRIDKQNMFDEQLNEIKKSLQHDYNETESKLKKEIMEEQQIVSNKMKTVAEQDMHIKKMELRESLIRERDNQIDTVLETLENQREQALQTLREKEESIFKSEEKKIEREMIFMYDKLDDDIADRLNAVLQHSKQTVQKFVFDLTLEFEKEKKEIETLLQDVTTKNKIIGHNDENVDHTNTLASLQSKLKVAMARLEEENIRVANLARSVIAQRKETRALQLQLKAMERLRDDRWENMAKKLFQANEILIKKLAKAAARRRRNKRYSRSPRPRRYSQSLTPGRNRESNKVPYHCKMRSLLKRRGDLYSTPESRLVDPHTLAEALLNQLHRRKVTVGQLFNLCDKDRSNSVTFGEFCTGIAASGIRPIPTAREMRCLFNVFDTDRNGHISFEEMKERYELHEDSSEEDLDFKVAL